MRSFSENVVCGDTNYGGVIKINTPSIAGRRIVALTDLSSNKLIDTLLKGLYSIAFFTNKYI